MATNSPRADQINDLWCYLILAAALHREQLRRCWVRATATMNPLVAPSPQQTYGVLPLWGYAPNLPTPAGRRYQTSLKSLTATNEPTHSPGAAGIAMTTLGPPATAASLTILGETLERTDRYTTSRGGLRGCVVVDGSLQRQTAGAGA